MSKCFECDSSENIHHHHVVPKVAKENGKKLGSPRNLTEDAISKGREKRINNKRNNIQWTKAIQRLNELINESDGVIHLSNLANQLNKEGYRTRKGHEYKPITVKRLLFIP